MTYLDPTGSQLGHKESIRDMAPMCTGNRRGGHRPRFAAWQARMAEPGRPPLDVVGMPGGLDRIVPDLRLEGSASEHAPEEAPPGGDVVVNR